MSLSSLYRCRAKSNRPGLQQQRISVPNLRCLLHMACLFVFTSCRESSRLGPQPKLQPAWRSNLLQQAITMMQPSPLSKKVARCQQANMLHFTPLMRSCVFAATVATRYELDSDMNASLANVLTPDLARRPMTNAQVYLNQSPLHCSSSSPSSTWSPSSSPLIMSLPSPSSSSSGGMSTKLPSKSSSDPFSA